MIEDRYFSARSSILFAIYTFTLFLSFSLALFLFASVLFFTCVSSVFLSCLSLSLARLSSLLFISYLLRHLLTPYSYLSLSRFFHYFHSLFVNCHCEDAAFLVFHSIFIFIATMFLFFFRVFFYAIFFAAVLIFTSFLFSYVNILQSLFFAILLFLFFTFSKFLSFTTFYNYFPISYSFLVFHCFFSLKVVIIFLYCFLLFCLILSLFFLFLRVSLSAIFLILSSWSVFFFQEHDLFLDVARGSRIVSRYPRPMVVRNKGPIMLLLLLLQQQQQQPRPTLLTFVLRHSKVYPTYEHPKLDIDFILWQDR